MVEQEQYGLKKTVDLPYAEAIEKVTAALKEQGFGVLTEIDVKETMKKKLDKDTNEYIILGACNPNLAYQALQAEPDIGLLLPCNVIVYAGDTPGQSVVSIIDPLVMMQVSANPALPEIAQQAADKLKAALEMV